jgi:hypothetical protein
MAGQLPRQCRQFGDPSHGWWTRTGNASFGQTICADHSEFGQQMHVKLLIDLYFEIGCERVVSSFFINIELSIFVQFPQLVPPGHRAQLAPHFLALRRQLHGLLVLLRPPLLFDPAVFG